MEWQIYRNITSSISICCPRCLFCVSSQYAPPLFYPPSSLRVQRGQTHCLIPETFWECHMCLRRLSLWQTSHTISGSVVSPSMAQAVVVQFSSRIGFKAHTLSPPGTVPSHLEELNAPTFFVVYSSHLDILGTGFGHRHSSKVLLAFDCIYSAFYSPQKWGHILFLANSEADCSFLYACKL